MAEDAADVGASSADRLRALSDAPPSLPSLQLERFAVAAGDHLALVDIADPRTASWLADQLHQAAPALHSSTGVLHQRLTAWQAAVAAAGDTLLAHQPLPSEGSPLAAQQASERERTASVSLLLDSCDYVTATRAFLATPPQRQDASWQQSRKRVIAHWLAMLTAQPALVLSPVAEDNNGAAVSADSAAASSVPSRRSSPRSIPPSRAADALAAQSDQLVRLLNDSTLVIAPRHVDREDTVTGVYVEEAELSRWRLLSLLACLLSEQELWQAYRDRRMADDAIDGDAVVLSQLAARSADLPRLIRYDALLCAKLFPQCLRAPGPLMESSATDPVCLASMLGELYLDRFLRAAERVSAACPVAVAPAVRMAMPATCYPVVPRATRNIPAVLHAVRSTMSAVRAVMAAAGACTHVLDLLPRLDSPAIASAMMQLVSSLIDQACSDQRIVPLSAEPSPLAPPSDDVSSITWLLADFAAGQGPGRAVRGVVTLLRSLSVLVHAVCSPDTRELQAFVAARLPDAVRHRIDALFPEHCASIEHQCAALAGAMLCLCVHQRWFLNVFRVPMPAALSSGLQARVAALSALVLDSFSTRFYAVCVAALDAQVWHSPRSIGDGVLVSPGLRAWHLQLASLRHDVCASLPLSAATALLALALQASLDVLVVRYTSPEYAPSSARTRQYAIDVCYVVAVVRAFAGVVTSACPAAPPPGSMSAAMQRGNLHAPLRHLACTDALLLTLLDAAALRAAPLHDVAQAVASMPASKDAVSAAEQAVRNSPVWLAEDHGMARQFSPCSVDASALSPAMLLCVIDWPTLLVRACVSPLLPEMLAQRCDMASCDVAPPAGHSAAIELIRGRIPKQTVHSEQ